MRRLVLITVIIDSAAWLQLLLLVVHLTGENVSALPQTPSTGILIQRVLFALIFRIKMVTFVV